MGPAKLKQNSSALRNSKSRSVSVEFLVICLNNDIKSQIKDACLTLPHAKTSFTSGNPRFCVHHWFIIIRKNLDNSVFLANIFAVWVESFRCGIESISHNWILQKFFHFTENFSGYCEEQSKKRRIYILMQILKKIESFLRKRIEFAGYCYNFECGPGSKKKQ